MLPQQKTTPMIISITVLSILAYNTPLMVTAKLISRRALVYRYRVSFDEVAGHMLEMDTFRRDLRMSFGQFLLLKQAINPIYQRDKYMANLRNGCIEVNVLLCDSYQADRSPI
ncbi:hypothetical protein SARC_13850 [Sphaeroforma arctica JP610]|uniref:Uncharacterized protein n=1 Tax=Sphaeroforma arctica JP610 TaxID=667725 RepID=A0A0L0FA64_9EUKA|nr:hypothetical protein SARC_13850 [Sphaeroforma arctica JP610]KNC73592.1 hypothetical protein SARC_13850 [Sphaeroforma arctica JP610]|eukprot:XP_014147494.1 hypothetical protein SARC_13850 [Sphaeroforma arctica JP610]